MLTLIGLALADPCGMVPPAWIPPGQVGIERTGDQQTYVFFADGVQTIAIRPGFTGSVDEFGMLIPMPAAPALRKIGDDTFAHLDKAVDAPSVHVDFYDPRQMMLEDMAMAEAEEMPMAKGAADSGLRFDEVRVVNQEAMGMYEVAVLEAGSPKALQRWMTERSYKYPDGMDDVVLDYVQTGWLFVAVKTRVGQMKGVEPRPGMRSVQPRLPKGASFNGNVQGMAFRFRVDRPIVPMRLSTFNGEDARNRVYMLSDRPVAIDGRPSDLVKRQVDGEQLYTNVMEPLPVTYSNGKASDVPSGYRDQLASMRDPKPHNGVGRDLMASDLLAVQLGELALPFETKEKELLNINEALGLRGAEVDKLVEDAVQVERDEALASVLPELKNHTLTVIEGDFGQRWLRENNLTFKGWSMDEGLNRPELWTRTHGNVGYLSIPKEADNGWWPF